jgi:hypothetical protein
MTILERSSVHRLQTALFALLLSSFCAPARTYVIPHILEKSGSIAQNTYTFDTTLFITYNQSIHGNDTGSATVEFYLYDSQTGEPMKGAAGEVCAPCKWQLDAQHRKISVSLENLIATADGFDTAIKLGFGIIVVSGNEDAVDVQALTVNSHSSAADLAVFGFDPQPVEPEPLSRRTYVIPHVFETKGSTAKEPYSYDTVLYATYAGGLPGTPVGAGASLDLYLFDQASGQPMIAEAGTAVCNPCSFPLGRGGSDAPRKLTVVIDNLITAAGGFGASNAKQGLGVLVVGGDDPGGVTLSGAIVNSHTGPFDLSVFGFEPQPIASSGRMATRKTFVIPHVLETSGRVAQETFTLTQPFSLRMRVGSQGSRTVKAPASTCIFMTMRGSRSWPLRERRCVPRALLNWAPAKPAHAHRGSNPSALTISS